MRLVATTDCKPGMRLGKPVFSITGQTLVNYQTELTGKMIERLHKLGYEYLYIEDAYSEGIFIEDSIRMETRLALRMSIERIISQIHTNPSIAGQGQLSVGSLIWESISMVERDLLYADNDIIMAINVGAKWNNVTFEHFIQNAINVCVYATKIGISSGLHSKDLESLSVGALLHDIGKLRLNAEILQKPSILTTTEFNHVQKHCEYGYDMLKGEPGIPMAASMCALMHHERNDGSGYPFGLSGEEIHPLARWVGLLDAYDAMTNPRPHRKALLPHEAMEILYTYAGTKFDMDKVELFRNKLAIFPVGVSVLLNTGEQGIVSKVNPACVQRPVIRVIKDATGAALRQPYEIDLSNKLHVMIERIENQVAV